MSRKKPLSQSAGKANKSTMGVEIKAAIIGGVLTIVAAFIGIVPSILNNIPPDVSPAPSATSPVAPLRVIRTPTLAFTKTLKPNFTPTRFTLTPTALPAEFVDGKGTLMRLVPASDFIMGSEAGFADERP